MSFTIEQKDEFKRNQSCKVCRHPERVKIDSLLFSGDLTQIKAAEMVGCDRRSINRHLQNHLARDLVVSGKGTRQELMAAIASIERRTEELLNAALKDDNKDIAIKALGRREAQIKLVAEITGNLQEKAPNIVAEQRKADQLERAIDNLIAKAKAEGLEQTPEEIIAELGKVEPDIFKHLHLTKWSGKQPASLVN